MMMNTRGLLNLVLLLVVIGLGVFVMYAPEHKTLVSTTALTTLTPTQVTHLEVARANGERYTLEKQGTQWRITAPLNIAANDARLTMLLGVLSTPSLARFDVKPAVLAQYALDKPKLTVRFNDVELAFGDTDPLQGRRYVRVNNAVHLIDDTYYPLLAEGLSGLISPDLLPAGAQITQLKLPTLTLTQNQDQRWEVTPLQPAASANAITGLVDAWQHAQALAVERITAAPSGEMVMLRLSNGNIVSLVIAQRSPELILARPDLGVQYHFVDSLAKRLFDLSAHEGK